MGGGHDLAFVRRVLGLFAGEQVELWVFGGWAEELRGLCGERPHSDLDLLYVGEDFDAFDAVTRRLGLEEVAAKRLPHKRAVVFDGVMVEMFLVRRHSEGLRTDFWGRVRHRWPVDLLGQFEGLPVASAAALAQYRQCHNQLHGRRVG